MIVGKDIEVNIDNKISSKKFLPRIKSKSLVIDDGISKLKKVFIQIVKKEKDVHLGLFKQKKYHMIKKETNKL